MQPIEIEPIGVAHTPFVQTHGIPRQGGGPAHVEIFEPYRPALQGLERSSHLWVIAFFHQAQRDVLLARPRKTSADGTPRGVFGMRAPVRPNPLGLSCARILEVKADGVVVDRLDYLDQTPIIDLKPYSPGWDLAPCAVSSHRYDPSRYVREELMEALSRDAEHALGPQRADSEAVRSLVVGLAALAADCDVDLRDTNTRYALREADERVEVLLCATGATFGNGRLCLAPLPERVAAQVRCSEKSFRIGVEGAIEAR